MSTVIQQVSDNLQRYYETQQTLSDARCEAKEAEADLKAAIISDSYLCHYVMTISYPKLRRALKQTGRRSL